MLVLSVLCFGLWLGLELKEGDAHASQVKIQYLRKFGLGCPENHFLVGPCFPLKVTFPATYE